MNLHFDSQGDGPILILLHGWGMNSGIWCRLLPQLQRHFTLLTVDLPGYGDNQHLHHYSWEQTVECFAQELPVGNWLGWSLGGLLAQQIAADYPSKVLQLITVASSAYFVEQADWPGMKIKVLQAFARGLEQDYRQTLERFLAIQMLGDPQVKSDIKPIRDALAERPQPPLSILRQGLQWLGTIDLRQQVSLIRQPWLQIFGDLDALVPRRSLQAHQALTFAEQIVMTKASHAPFISNPELFKKILLNFLKFD